MSSLGVYSSHFCNLCQILSPCILLYTCVVCEDPKNIYVKEGLTMRFSGILTDGVLFLHPNRAARNHTEVAEGQCQG